MVILERNFLGGDSMIGWELRFKFQERITITHFSLHDNIERYIVFF